MSHQSDHSFPVYLYGSGVRQRKGSDTGVLMMSALVVRPQETFLFYGICFVGNVANRWKQVMKLHP